MTTPNHSPKQRKTIGVFVSHLGRVWVPEFIQGITAAAEAQDLNMICFVGGKPVAFQNPGHAQPSYGLYDVARTEQLAGIIVSSDLGYELNPQEMHEFFKNYDHIPLIVNALKVDGSPNLIADNLNGMRAILRHLLEVHGYTRIAFIRGPQNQIEAAQRFQAYQDELQAHNLPFDDQLVLPGDFSEESGRAAIHTLLDERGLSCKSHARGLREVEAIAAANDRMAIGAFEALQLRGIQVPGGIALTGFDDIREARSLGVPLTTARQSFYEMGAQAVDLLQRRMDGEKLPETILTPTHLMVRWSCGCLPESVQKVIGKDEITRPVLPGNRREVVILNLMQAAQMHAASPQALAFKQAGGQAWDTLLDSLRADSLPDAFLRSLENLFDTLAPHSQDTAVWHNVLSTLRQQALAGIHQQDVILRAENLFEQARIMTGELAQRSQAAQRLRMGLQEEVLQAFSSSMAPAMSFDEIGAAVQRHFPDLGIERMYVMMYASMITPQTTLVPPSSNYHLLMQFDDLGFHMPQDRPKWATGHLIPRGKTPENRRYAAIVIPLNLAQNRFGFMWIEMNALQWDAYVRIRNLLSSALLRTMLVDQRAQVQKQVEHLLQESQTREQQLALANETARTIAGENARLYTNELSRRKDAEALSRVARNLSMLLNMGELPNHILQELASLVPYERAALLMENALGAVHVMAQDGFPENIHADDVLAQVDSGGVYARIVQSGEAIMLDDIASAGAWQPFDWLPVNHSWIGAPLVSKGKVIGMLSLSREGVAAFNRDDLLLVTTFSTQAAISLENARLYDEQTRFNEMLERLVRERVEELNTAYRKLEKLDKNKSSFIEITAHELRTPLTVIKGYLGMLNANPEIRADRELLQAVEGMSRGAERLQLIFDSMLDVVRFDEDAIQPRLETVVVILLLQLIHKKYKPDLAARSLTLNFEPGLSSLPMIQADPQLLQKALDAVIVNAIKFTPDGGSISLGGRELLDEQLGPCLEIHIRDTGIGIDPANQQVIFEKLFQLGKTELHSSGRTKFKGGGPGLGLSIAASIVKAHHGRIWVESPACDEQTFPGSTFYLRLPLPKPAM